MLKLLVTLLVACAVTAAPPQHGHSGRIVGGETAQPGQFPFMVSLNVDFVILLQEWCGASIINKNWIVTAAQCVVGFTNDIFIIKAGTNLLNTGGTNYTVAAIFSHPGFNATVPTDDIALIQVNGEISLSDTIGAIEIGTAPDNASCTVIGWGSTDTSDSSNELQFADMTALSDEDCTRLAEGGQFVFERGPGQVCALASEGVSPCYGDSGGPLVCDNKLVGVVSYGISPCGHGYPDVYTRVAYYEDWINGIMSNA